MCTCLHLHVPLNIQTTLFSPEGQIYFQFARSTGRMHPFPKTSFAMECSPSMCSKAHRTVKVGSESREMFKNNNMLKPHPILYHATTIRKWDENNKTRKKSANKKQSKAHKGADHKLMHSANERQWEYKHDVLSFRMNLHLEVYLETNVFLHQDASLWLWDVDGPTTSPTWRYVSTLQKNLHQVPQMQ